MLTQILIPLTWKFFLSFQYLTSAKSVIYILKKLNEYLIFYISYTIYVFSTVKFYSIFPFLNYINANIQIIRKFRKLYYFFFLIFATLVSPPIFLVNFNKCYRYYPYEALILRFY
jgi:hypothetical protein